MTTKGSRRRAAARSTAASIAGPRPATVLLATGLGLLVLAPAARAQAAESASTTVRWTAPGASVRGTVPVKAKVSSDVAADGWLLRLLGPDGRPVSETLCGEDFPAPSRSFLVQCRWDTVHGAGGHPAANQRYLLRLMVRTGGGLAPVGEDRAAATFNPAEAPGHVELKTAADGRTVLSWAANPEPDILHYDVEKPAGSGDWTRVGEPTGTNFEPGDGPGRQTFRVGAERRGPDGEAIAPTEWTTIDGTADSSPSRSGARSSAEPRADEPSGGTDGAKGPRRSGRPGPSPEKGDQPRSPRSGDGTDGRSDRRGRSGAGAGSDAGPPSGSAESRPAGSGTGSPSGSAESRPAGSGTGSPSGSAESRPAGSDTRSRSGSRSRRKAAPSPQSGAPSDKRDSRGNGSEAVTETPAASASPDQPGRHSSEPASTAAADTPPADRAGLRFSESSAAAFHSLAVGAPNPSGRPATVKPAPTAKRPAAPVGVSEPDPGFGQTLPYAEPEGGQETAEEQAAPATPPVSTPMPASASEPLPQHRSNGRQRAEGLALAVTGFALLGLLARPGRRSRRRPGPQSLPTGEVAPALADLAARVASIEARLGGAEDGTR